MATAIPSKSDGGFSRRVNFIRELKHRRFRCPVRFEMTEKSLTRGKLLIVDDDDDSRTILAFLLEDEGWKIAEARNGKEALEKLVMEQPDVLILDNRMPEITGAEVCQRLRQQGIDIPVVLITAYSDLDELASSLGVRYYLRKPLDLPEVLAKIESAYLENFSGQ